MAEKQDHIRVERVPSDSPYIALSRFVDAIADGGGEVSITAQTLYNALTEYVIDHPAFADSTLESDPRVVELVEAAESILPWVERTLPKVEHEGSCGPHSSCDVQCMDAFYCGQRVSRLRLAIRAFPIKSGNENG